MAYRVIYIFKDPREDVYWFSEIKHETSRPIVGDLVMLSNDDIGAKQAEVAKVYRWEIPASIDFEATILPPNYYPNHAYVMDQQEVSFLRDWLIARRFRQIPRHEYADLFDIPELAERWPRPETT